METIDVNMKLAYKIDMEFTPETTLVFLGNIYRVTQDNKCYYKDVHVPLVVERLSDGRIDSSTANFDVIKASISPELYEKLGFAKKEICPRHGKLSSCWLLNCRY